MWSSGLAALFDSMYSAMSEVSCVRAPEKAHSLDARAAREAQIDEHGLQRLSIARDHDILRLHVAMDDTMRGEVSEGAGHVRVFDGAHIPEAAESADVA